MSELLDLLGQAEKIVQRERQNADAVYGLLLLDVLDDLAEVSARVHQLAEAIGGRNAC
jgi:hypothetical protein